MSKLYVVQTAVEGEHHSVTMDCEHERIKELGTVSGEHKEGEGKRHGGVKRQET